MLQAICQQLFAANHIIIEIFRCFLPRRARLGLPKPLVPLSGGSDRNGFLRGGGGEEPVLYENSIDAPEAFVYTEIPAYI